MGSSIAELRRFNSEISFNQILQVIILRKLKNKYPNLNFENEEMRNNYFCCVKYLLSGIDREKSLSFEDVPANEEECENLRNLELKTKRMSKRRGAGGGGRM